MSHARPARRRALSRLRPWIWVIGPAWLVPVACSGSGSTPRPMLTGEAQVASAADPSRSAHHGWDAVDRAVQDGAIEHLVVATPVESVGTRFRTYRLLGPRDQPGELVAERTEDGLELRVRIGRFGRPDLEAQVLRSVREALAGS